MAEGNGVSRVALVNGASRGIGRGIAWRLAADGLDVAVNDIQDNEGELNDAVESIREAGRRSVAVPADISDPEAVEEMVRRVRDELGQLDVMVANAGVAEVKELLDLTPEDWDRMMAINLRGRFLCYQEAAQMIRQGKGGKIIGAASIVAYRPFPMLRQYSVSKWGCAGSRRPRRWSGPSTTSPSTRTAPG